MAVADWSAVGRVVNCAATIIDERPMGRIQDPLRTLGIYQIYIYVLYHALRRASLFVLSEGIQEERVGSTSNTERGGLETGSGTPYGSLGTALSYSVVGQGKEAAK